MAQITVDAERRIAAPAGTVYGVLAEMTKLHPQILPPAFSDFRVISGGFGAGTVVAFTITAGGRQRDYEMAVAEPEPGRVLTESDTHSSLVTTFTVVPDGEDCQTRISSTWEGAAGIGGFFERRFAPRALRSIYTEELEQLEVFARELGTVGG